MALRIDTPQTAYTNYSVVLGGVTYSLTQRWNDRVGAWYLDIYTAGGEVIRKGAKLLSRNPLVISNKSLMPDGNLYVILQIDGYQEPVGRNNLGVDSAYSLVYLTTEEEGESQ